MTTTCSSTTRRANSNSSTCPADGVHPSAPGVVDSFSPSPDGQYMLVATLKRPYSRLVPSSGYAKQVAIMDRSGKVAKAIADVPTTEHVPILGVITGPRAYQWNEAEPSTVVWVEALDEGDPRRQVSSRDRIVTLKAPFSGTPSEIMKTEYRYRRMAWTEKNIAL